MVCIMISLPQSGRFLEVKRKMDKESPQNQADLKFHNLRLVLNTIRSRPGSSKADIGGIAKMSTPGITRIVSQLLDAGLIRAGAVTMGHLGRRALLYEADPDAFYALAIELDARKLRLGIFDFQCGAVAKSGISMPARMRMEDVVSCSCREYDRLLEEYHLDSDEVVSIGISCVGMVDPSEGTVRFSPQFHWENAALQKCAQEKFGKDTVIENG